MKGSEEYDRYLERVYGIKGGQGRTPSDIAGYAQYAGFCLIASIVFFVVVITVKGF